MPTTLIRSIYNLTPAQQGGVVTIGNFDGVHVGHQHLIGRVVQKARELGVPSVVITFEPHPFEFFSELKALNIPRLTRLREKFRALEACGVDHVVILPFNQQLADQSASDFVKVHLHQALGPRHVIIGDDFRFGHQRQGDFALLQSLGKQYGFEVEASDTIQVNGERVSSTRIRKALAENDLALAEKLLGRPYAMLGRVRRGDQRGRQFGFPTANLFLHRQHTPVKGVYTVFMHGVANKPWPGVANLGVRPTVDGMRTLLEVHLLDFKQELYGSYVKVEFCEKLRDEKRYPDIELLKQQIALDVQNARHYFKQKGVL